MSTIIHKHITNYYFHEISDQAKINMLTLDIPDLKLYNKILKIIISFSCEH